MCQGASINMLVMTWENVPTPLKKKCPKFWKTKTLHIPVATYDMKDHDSSGKSLIFQTGNNQLLNLSQTFDRVCHPYPSTHLRDFLIIPIIITGCCVWIFKAALRRSRCFVNRLLANFTQVIKVAPGLIVPFLRLCFEFSKRHKCFCWAGYHI